ncbi:hypothetical protein [Streptomyces akebiae]|uniref:Uncharacterized protein n=1 Tax=Streptomyces akebiae TaxID=2865673 RepID=A0ABX8XJR3_9ACTN|nr:hypothetical protein [Streptomyces akebiae]QYX76163.1 hypothetical protein K1J60_06275 [Streptomyces akebiae]
MADLPSRPDAPDDHRAPRWVKISAAVVVALIVVFVIVHLAGGGMVGHAP